MANEKHSKLRNLLFGTEDVSSIMLGFILAIIVMLAAVFMTKAMPISRLVIGNWKLEITNYHLPITNPEDLGRAVRSIRYKYIHNDYPDLPATPPADVGRSRTFDAMRRLRAQGKLNENQMACFAKPRPVEELYDVINDPHEMHNLVDDPRYADVLKEHRRALIDWSQRTDFRIPLIRTPDEFNRETGEPLPNRIRPRPSKRDFQKAMSEGSL